MQQLYCPRCGGVVGVRHGPLVVVLHSGRYFRNPDIISCNSRLHPGERLSDNTTVLHGHNCGQFLAVQREGDEVRLRTMANPASLHDKAALVAALLELTGAGKLTLLPTEP